MRRRKPYGLQEEDAVISGLATKLRALRVTYPGMSLLSAVNTSLLTLPTGLLFMYLGGGVLAVSFFLPVHGVTNQELQLLSGGAFFVGLGEWKNHKEQTFIKPPNAYTGPAAMVSSTVRQPDWPGRLLILAGTALLLFGIWKIIRAALIRRFMPSFLRLNYETHTPALYGPSPVVPKVTLYETGSSVSSPLCEERPKSLPGAESVEILL